jgi:hypothetical protein
LVKNKDQWRETISPPLIRRWLKNFAHPGFEPGNIVFIQPVAHGWPFGDTANPASLTQHLQMLRYRRLGDGQKFDDVTGDAAGTRDQEFHNFKADGLPNALNIATKRSCSAPEISKVQQGGGIVIGSRVRVIMLQISIHRIFTMIVVYLIKRYLSSPQFLLSSLVLYAYLEDDLS